MRKMAGLLLARVFLLKWIWKLIMLSTHSFLDIFPNEPLISQSVLYHRQSWYNASPLVQATCWQVEIRRVSSDTKKSTFSFSTRFNTGYLSFFNLLVNKWLEWFHRFPIFEVCKPVTFMFLLKNWTNPSLSVHIREKGVSIFPFYLCILALIKAFTFGSTLYARDGNGARRTICRARITAIPVQSVRAYQLIWTVDKSPARQILFGLLQAHHSKIAQN